MSNRQAVKNDLHFEIENKERKLDKLKFCIISCHKSQMSRNQLLLFTLENNNII